MTTSAWSRGVQRLGVVAVVLAAASAACGGGGSGGDTSPFGTVSDAGTAPEGGGVGTDAGDAGNLIGNKTHSRRSPSRRRAPPSRAPTARRSSSPSPLQAHYTDGSISTLSRRRLVDERLARRRRDRRRGHVHGERRRSAASSTSRPATRARTPSATLDREAAAPAEPAATCRRRRAGAACRARRTPDATVVWAYPYDGTVWPRGLLAAHAAVERRRGDRRLLRAHRQPDLRAAGFHHGDAARPLRSSLLDATTWAQFTDSTSGPTTITVARWDGTAATRHRQADVDHRARVDARHHLLLVEQPGSRAAHQARRRAARRLRQPGRRSTTRASTRRTAA